MKGSQLIRRGSSAYERNIAGKQYKFLVKTEHTVGKTVYQLKEGDVLWHQSTIPHRIKNSSDKKAIIFTVDTPPTFT
jgi:hypothetical protein